MSTVSREDLQALLKYEDSTAHYPTVTDGAALVLYLLPSGEIEFTGQ